ncbi:hypothetical protein Bca4012_065083 [Brassica carinata]
MIEKQSTVEEGGRLGARTEQRVTHFNLSAWVSLLGSSPYIGLKHMGIYISPKSSNPEKKRRCSKGMVIRASLFGVGTPEALVIGVVALLVLAMWRLL